METKGLVLLVDDSMVTRKVIKAMFTAEGFQVHQASSGDEAIMLAKNTHYDLVLLDVMMDGKDGYQTCPELKRVSKNPLMPVLFLTAQGGEGDVREGFSAGGSEYLLKPFNAEQAWPRIYRIMKDNHILRSKDALLRECDRVLEDSLRELSSKMDSQEVTKILDDLGALRSALEGSIKSGLEY